MFTMQPIRNQTTCDTATQPNPLNQIITHGPDIIDPESSRGYNSSIIPQPTSNTASTYNIPYYLHNVFPYLPDNEINSSCLSYSFWSTLYRYPQFFNSNKQNFNTNSYPNYNLQSHLNKNCSSKIVTTSSIHESKDSTKSLETNSLGLCGPTSFEDLKLALERSVEEQKTALRRLKQCKCKKCVDRAEAEEKKVYKCIYEGCGKTYTKISSLKDHHRCHLDDRPFKCVTCSKSFMRSDVLQRHSRTHTGEKNFGCDVCSKRFSRSDHLSKHKKTHQKNLESIPFEVKF